MREIIFRGKTLDKGEWVYGVPVIAKDNIADKDVTVMVDNPNEIVPREGLPLFEQVDPETVGQYTGLKDRNGKKIFEGDIVKYECYILIVAYHNEYAGFWPFYDQDSGVGYGVCGDKCEVIGNCIDNPELLEGE
jgi:uncharacterized phage protein (TIGR01671 family)